MKKYLLILTFFLFAIKGFATTYYFNGTAGGLTTFASGVYSNWGQNTDGSAGAGRPADFTTAGNTFIVANVGAANGVITLTTSWVVSGAGSKIIIGNGTGEIRLNVNSGGTLAAPTIDIVTNTVNGQNRLVFNIGSVYSGVTLGSLFTNSIVMYNANSGTQAILPGTYGNLWVHNLVDAQLTGSNTITIATQLQINNGGTLSTSGTATIAGGFTTSTTGVSPNTLKIGSTAATPITTGRNYNFNVSYNANADQTVMDGSYTNLTIEGGATTQKVKSHINNSTTSTISGILAINNLSTFLLPNGSIAKLLGAFTTSSTTPTTALLNLGCNVVSPIVSGKTYNFNVEYSSLGYTNPIGGTFNQNFTISGLNNNNGHYCGSEVFNILGTFNFTATYSGGVFDPQTSTFNLAGSGAQTVPARTFYNVTLSNAGTKTLTGVTVNGKLSMQGTATASVAPTYGAAASLEYNTATARNSGVEWITPFLGTGGVMIDNTGIITLTSARVFGNNTNVPLNIKTGATLATANFGLTFHGDFINAGTLTAGSSPIIITGSTAAHNIGGFTTTGQISMTKSAGKALVTGNWPISGTGSFPLLINGSGSGILEFNSTSHANHNSFTTTGALTIQGGLLRLNNFFIDTTGNPSALPHIHQVGSLTQTGGTVDFSDKNFTPNLHVRLNVSGDFSKTAGVFQTSNSSVTGSFGLVQFNGTTQNIQCSTPFNQNTEVTYHVTSGSTCTFSGGTPFNLSSTSESFDVKNGGTLIFGGNAVINSGPGYFTLAGGATIKTSNTDGINCNGAFSNTGTIGSIQTGTRYLSAQGNIEYNGTVPQNTGVFTTINDGSSVQTSPTAINNLTINNSPAATGLVTLQQDLVVNGVFTQTAGKFAIGGTASTPQTLTLNGTAASATATNSLQANSYSNLVIGGTGAFGGSLFFDNTPATAGKSSGADANGSLGNLTPGTTNNIKDFTLNRGGGATITLGNIMQVNNTLTPTAGTLASNGNLVMLSTDAATSSILALGAGASITGDVVVQVFFKGGTVAANRGYRMIASPTANTATFFPQIKERFIVTCANGLTDGCDFPPVKQPTAQTLTNYLEPGIPGATSFGNINHSSTMEIGRGYYFFFRGSRANLNATAAGKINEPFVVPEDWTAAYTGTINSGNINVPVTKTTTADVATDGLNLVGNPYPAVLNFTTFHNDGSNSGVIDDYVMIMKRDRSGFFSYSGGVLSGSLTLTESAGATPGTAKYPYIQPGQAFFVRKTATGAPLNITFKEAHKAAAANSKEALRTLNVKDEKVILTTPVYPAIRQLIRFNIKSDVTQDDATIVLEEGNSANWGGNDAPYMANNTIYTYSLTADGIPTAINFMPAVTNVKEIKLFVESTKSDANLKLNFTELVGAGKNDVWLTDNYTQTNTLITSTDNSYSFSIDKSIKATSGKDRFVLFFVPKVVLPITLTNFTAIKTNAGAQLNWETKTETNAAKFEVQQSIDGINFTTLKIVETKAVNGNSTLALTYSYVDKTIQSGIVYYRLKMIDKDGAFKTSDLKSVNFSLSDVNAIILYPNPVKDELNIRWQQKTAQSVNLAIYDVTGKIVKNYTKIKGQTFTTNVANLNTGVYFLKLKDELTNKLIAAKKFTKISK